ncbi:MAG TPA: translation initiation factor IF-2 [Chitinophagaceae bacterium]|nr:translation initiation factor IF-2 [Chitinophagaceae bacterium]
MPETTNIPRLLAAAKEFNIGKDTLVEFLNGKGFALGEAKTTTKLSAEMYTALQQEFQQDKVNKKKSDQIDLPKGTGGEGGSRRREDEEITFKKKDRDPAKEAVKETQKSRPEVLRPEISTQITEVPRTEAPKIDGPKVVATIDLEAMNLATRPKKAGTEKKKTASTEEPATVQSGTEESSVEINIPEATVTEPVVPATEEGEPAPVIENIKADKLSGPKLVGKISLPVPDKKDIKPGVRRREDKRRRKRIPIDKKPEQLKLQPQQGGRSGEKGKTRLGDRRKSDRRRQHTPDKEINEKEIQDKIKDTLAKLGGAARGKSAKSKYRRARREEMAELQASGAEVGNKLQVTEFISVSEFANLMNVNFGEVISKCMSLGIMVSINQRLDAEVIELVAGEFGFEVEFIGIDEHEEMEEEQQEDDPEDLKPRPPVVTIMGHVDHGKTSLLDFIRSASVVAGEVGGITQHIGAYEVSLPSGKKICFLDTPGHEAFTAMRARGAKGADIAVIVIAADDAIMPQTREAISHAQAANAPMIFAINKIDKEGANPEKIKEQLSAMNLLVEDWGGKYQSQEISAKNGTNMELLLEKILLEAEVLDLKANPDREAAGTIIEASLDKGRGFVATVLVQNGTLKVGDTVVSGSNYGKVKAMANERGQKLDFAGPSTPVQLLGLNGAPQAGETFRVYDDESDAKDTANRRSQIMREQGIRAKKHITLDEIGRRLALGNFKELNLIIKGDVDGSVEALSDSLQQLSTQEILVNIVHKAVGQITESDVLLATASDAIIVGFQVRPSTQASRLAEKENIEIRTYSIIYDAIEEIKSAMEGMLEPKIEDNILCNAEVKETYRFEKVTVAGCMVLEGKITRSARVRVIRDGIVVFNGELGSLKRFKDDMKEVAAGMECGLSIRSYNDVKTGDIIEGYEEVEVKRTL